MPEGKYVVTAESDGGETIMAVWDDLYHAAKCADMLRRNGYKTVKVKRFTEAV